LSGSWDWEDLGYDKLKRIMKIVNE